MFQFPGLVILAIAATRVYRSLTDFVTGGTHMYEFLPFLTSRMPIVTGVIPVLRTVPEIVFRCQMSCRPPPDRFR